MTLALQATAEHKHYFLYVCESDGQVILYAVLFGYKGVLQVLALLLAFRTRHVKVKGLDDSVYIAASVYVTSIVLTVIIVSTYTLRAYVNAYPAVVGMGLLLGTTMILGLVFIPRVRNFVDYDRTKLPAILTHNFHFAVSVIDGGALQRSQWRINYHISNIGPKGRCE